MPNILLRQDLGNTEPRSANVTIKNEGLSNIDLDNNFNNINNAIEYNQNSIESLYISCNGSYSLANNVEEVLHESFNQANTGVIQAQAAFAVANNVASQIEPVFNQANTGVIQAQAGFAVANTKFSSSGGTISGSVEISSDLLVTGNLTVTGNVTTISANNLTVQDNMIYLNDGANVANPDLGISGNYNDGTYRHTGFFRDATDGYWKVYDQYLPEPDVSPYIDINDVTFRIADFQANNITGNTFSGLANNSNYLNGFNSDYFTNASNISSGTLSNDRLNSVPNSSLANSTITINGTEIALGSSGEIIAGATITDDTSSNTTRYIMLGVSTSGAYTVANTSSTKLTFNPSTGLLTATSFSGSGSSITNLTAGNLVGTISSSVLGNSSLYIGTTSISLNRSSSSLSLTGITSIDGSAASLTTARTLTIGNSGKSFDGSSDISWTLNDIGAYANTNPSGYTTNTGTVTSVSGTGTVSGLSLSGTVTTSGNITLGGTLSVSASNFSSQTANYFLAAPNGTSGTPTFRSIVAADVPTLNQNTTGSAGSVTNSLTFNTSGGAAAGTSYNGSAARTIDYSTIGAAASSHTHNYAGSSSAGGAATSLENFTISTTSSLGADNSTSAIGYIAGVSIFGQTDGALYSHVYSASWKHNIYGDYRTGQLAIRGKNNGTWGSWRTVLDSSNYTSYSPSLTGSGASGTWGISISGSAGSASTSSQVTINYNNNSASTYQMLWGSGNSVYGTAQIYCNPSTDYLYSGSFYCGNWFRSTGSTGWYNESYGGGINMSDSTWVRVYNNKQFYSQNYIQSDSSVRAPIFYDSNDTGYYCNPNSGSRFYQLTNTGRHYCNEWIQFDNYTGLYSPLNAAHFYPNNATYGSWRLQGTRNGWTGIEFSDGSTTLMMNTDSYGFHYNGVGWRMYVSGGSLYVPGNITAYWSDIRLKENLREIKEECFEILNSFTAYRFNWNKKVQEFNIPIEAGKEEIGLIAQEVQKSLPDAVKVNKILNSPDNQDNSEKEYFTIDYDKITPLLVEAVNILKNQIEIQSKEIQSLKQLIK